jgi:hypothetical protein
VTSCEELGRARRSSNSRQSCGGSKRDAAYQCAGPGLDMKRQRTLTACAMSGRVAMAGYINAPTALTYGLLRMNSWSSGVWGHWDMSRHEPGSSGVETGLQSAKLKQSSRSSVYWRWLRCRVCAERLRLIWTPRRNKVHQENRKALVGLATRPNQSQTRANQTRPDQKADQSTRGPLCLKPEVAHNGFFIMNLHLNHEVFLTRTTRPDQSTRAFRFC